MAKSLIRRRMVVDSFRCEAVLLEVREHRSAMADFRGCERPETTLLSREHPRTSPIALSLVALEAQGMVAIRANDTPVLELRFPVAAPLTKVPVLLAFVNGCC